MVCCRLGSRSWILGRSYCCCGCYCGCVYRCLCCMFVVLSPSLLLLQLLFLRGSYDWTPVPFRSSYLLLITLLLVTYCPDSSVFWGSEWSLGLLPTPATFKPCECPSTNLFFQPGPPKELEVLGEGRETLIWRPRNLKMSCDGTIDPM